MITCYEDFLQELQNAGFSMGGGNADGIYSVISWNWDEAPPYDTPVRWHTGDRNTDPWEWRMRVLEERDDIAYAKLFFKKSGYITADWYPYFLAARRGNRSFEDAYQAGMISHDAKLLYDVIVEEGAIPLHSLKALANLNAKEHKARFDKALTELQMRMFITMCAQKQKQSASGEEYGWFSTVFCTVESYFSQEVVSKAISLQAEEAAETIRRQILRLNPLAVPKIMDKFIFG